MWSALREHGAPILEDICAIYLDVDAIMMLLSYHTQLYRGATTSINVLSSFFAFLHLNSTKIIDEHSASA